MTENLLDKHDELNELVEYRFAIQSDMNILKEKLENMK